MAIRLALLGSAHVHAPGLRDVAVASGAEWVGVFDREAPLDSMKSWADPAGLVREADAVVIASKTSEHLEFAELAAAHGKPTLLEKPVAKTLEEAKAIASLASKAPIMMAMPCPYTLAWERGLQRYRAGEIGTWLSICATNRGKNPGGWLEQDGAILDHVVHVADLLFKLVQEEPRQVSAATSGSPETSAMLTLDYAGGRFVTLDSSWSRPASYSRWGDVGLNLVGVEGVIELDLFAQNIEVYGEARHSGAYYGSSPDARMFAAFLNLVQRGEEPLTTVKDGLRAQRIVEAALDSMRTGGEPVPVRPIE